MSATNATAAAILALYFTNANDTGVGDAGGLLGSVTPGVFYISLHTADPTETGNQASSEATYTGYARVAVARSTSGWTVTTADPANVTNDAAVTFGACTAGSESATFVGIGDDASGVGTLRFSQALDAALAISAGITPEFAINALNITAD